MRPARLTRLAICAIGLGSTLTAAAQGPSHAHHAPSSSASSLAAAQPPPGASAIAYMSGKQAMVGLHAPSTKSVETDARGRPMLALTTINRGESLAVASDGEEGGFASSDSTEWPTCCER